MKYNFNDEKHVHTLTKEDGEVSPLTGTSTVTGVIAKPLTWWAVGIALRLFGWTPLKDKNRKWIPKDKRIEALTERHAEIKELPVDKFLKLLDEAYYAHNNFKNEAAIDGTRLHKLCEDWINAQMAGETVEHDPLIQPLVDWSNENVKEWLWSEVNCYSEEHWVGGISDAGFVDNEGKVGLLDFKSSKDAYTSYFIQCAGYDLQITENGGWTAEGEKVFDLGDRKIDYYAVMPFGMEKVEMKTRYNTEEMRKGFLSALCLHRLVK